MKRYGQWCGLAQALDRLGDRWTLLIVRELLLGPRRYSDLLRDVGGIATNLLAARLTALEAEAIIERREVPPPTPATLYQLTERGRALEESVLALIRWGGQFLPLAPPDDEFRPEWLALALKATLTPKAARLPGATLAIVLPDVGIWVRVDEGGVTSGHLGAG